jgi:ketosteroid isomerase-like protein
MTLRCGAVICAAVSALLTACASSPPDTRDADVLALKDTEAAWVKDAATKDLDKWVAHYTDDASVLLPNTPLLTGKPAISAALKPMMSDSNFSVRFGATKVDVAKSGDLGYTQGSYSLVQTNPKTKTAETEKGKYLTIYRKQADGTWKAVEDTFMSDAPPPPTVQARNKRVSRNAKRR